MMKSILRRMRGALGTAVTWAVAWAGGGFGLAALLFMASPRLGLGLFADAAPMITLLAGATGFVGGTVFSAVLGTVHGRRSLADLSAVRIALWGGLAGMLVPLGVIAGAAIWGAVPLSVGSLGTAALVFGGLGAATGGGTIMLAQAGAGEIDGGGRRGVLGPGD